MMRMPFREKLGLHFMRGQKQERCDEGCHVTYLKYFNNLKRFKGLQYESLGEGLSPP